jgi:hypothetical protein
MNSATTSDPASEKDLEKIIAQNTEALSSIQDLAKRLQFSGATDDMINQRNIADLMKEGSGH